jgi:hypothetical protein
VSDKGETRNDMMFALKQAKWVLLSYKSFDFHGQKGHNLFKFRGFGEKIEMGFF